MAKFGELLKSRRAWTYVWLAAYLLATGVIFFESCMTGAISTEHSTNVGNGLADILDAVGGEYQDNVVLPTGVEITNKPNYTTVKVGDIYQFSASVIPSNSSYAGIGYSSSDESVATVNGEGLANFLDSGKATITVTSDYDSKLKDSFSFTVEEVYPTAITSIVTGVSSQAETEKDDSGAYLLYTNTTYQIRTSLEPYNVSAGALTYTSDAADHENLFSFDDAGKIVAISETQGRAYSITVSTENGLTSTVSFKILQKAAEEVIPLESMTLSGSPDISISLNDTVNFASLSSPKLVFAPSNATYKQYKLESSDTSVATISGTKIKGVGVGTADIKVVCTHYPSIYTTLHVTVSEVELTSFAINVNSGSQLFVDHSYNISIGSVKPSNASIYKGNYKSTLQVTSSNTDVATIDSSNKLKVNCLTAGTSTITVKMLKSPSADTSLDTSWVTATREITVNPPKEATSFDISVDFSGGIKTPGYDTYVEVGKEYTLSECITLGGLYDNNGTSVTLADYDTDLSFYMDGAQITGAFKVDQASSGSIEVRIYPYKDDDQSYLSKEIDYEAFVPLTGIKIGGETRNVSIDTTLVGGSRYVDLGEVSLEAFHSFSANVLSAQESVYSLSVISGSECVSISTPSTSDEFTISAIQAGSAGILISPYDQNGNPIEFGYLLTVNVHEVSATSLNVTIKRGEETIVPDDVSGPDGNVYLLGGSYWSNHPDLVQLVVGTTLTFDVSLDPVPSYQNVEFVVEQGDLEVNAPNVKLKSAGLAVLVIRDNHSGLSAKFYIAVTNVIALNPDVNFMINRSNAHRGVLEEADDGSFVITSGYSYRMRLMFSNEATYRVAEYSSSDPETLHVSENGTLTPIKAGKVTITAKSDDGFSPGIVLNVEFTVNAPSIVDEIADFSYLIRKGVGHFGAFLVLGVCSSMFYYLAFDKHRKLFAIPVFLNLLSGFCVAGFTELIQYYVPGRWAKWSDVILDMTGLGVSVGVITLIFLTVYIILWVRKKKAAKAASEESQKD